MFYCVMQDAAGFAVQGKTRMTMKRLGLLLLLSGGLMTLGCYDQFIEVTPPECANANCVFCPPQAIGDLGFVATEGLQLAVVSSATNDGAIDGETISVTLEGTADLDLRLLLASAMVESGTIAVQADSFAVYRVTAGGAAGDTSIAIPEEDVTVSSQEPVFSVAIGPQDGVDVALEGDTPSAVAFTLSEFVLNTVFTTGDFPPTEVAFTAGAEDSPCIIQGDGFNLEIGG